MKRIIYSLFITLTFVLVSCDESTQDPSIITHFVTFEMLGEETELIPVGTPYVDAGVVAMEGEQDITANVVKKGEVNTNEINLYTITYSAVNKDGFESSINRTVIVYDPAINVNVEGTYTVASGSYRYWLDDGAIVSFAGTTVDIDYVAPGFFYCSDYMGGYYDQRAGYGSGYAMKGYFKLNADNTIDILSGDVAAWGDSYNFMENAKFDPVANSLYWELGYAGSMIFYITLKK